MSLSSKNKAFKRSFAVWQLFLLPLLSIFATGCDDDVNPFIGTDLPYTVWGLVNPDADTQAVRVFEIDDILRLVNPEPLNATVSIIDVGNSNRFVLRDSVIQLANGDYRHIFWGRIPVDYHQIFRVEVERSDGALTKSSDVKVPGPIAIHVSPANINSATTLVQPLWIEGDPPSTPRIDVTYFAYTVNSARIRLIDNPVTISYANKTRFARDTLRLELDLREDFKAVREDFEMKDFEGLLCVDDVEVSIHVGNEEWRSPTGVFDPDFLVEPGTLTNVENGFGFFGAGFVESIRLLPPELLLVRAGFIGCANFEGG